MTCRICSAKSDAFSQAALIAGGEDDGTGEEYDFFCPGLGTVYNHKAHIHRQAAESHEDNFHDRH